MTLKKDPQDLPQDDSQSTLPALRFVSPSEVPPLRPSNRGFWADVVKQIRSSPLEWAKISGDFPNQISSYIKKRYSTDAGTVETRPVGNNRLTNRITGIYLRWVPADSDQNNQSN